MNARFAKRFLFLLERLRGEPLEHFLGEMEQNQGLDAPSLYALQQRKLADLLQFVVAHNPYYADKYAGYDAGSAFHTLPLLTKAELREHYKRVVTPGYERKVSLCKTSGSTGQPLKFYRDSEVFGRTLASVYRAHRWYGIDVGAREAMLWGIPSGRIARLRMRLRDAVLNRFREEEYSLSPSVLRAFHDRVRRDGPEYVFGYSSMVYEFAVFLREHGLTLSAGHLKGAVCTAESIPDYQRAVIEDALGCPVISEYGSAETGILSYQCPMGRHHISSDAVLLETLDDAGATTPSGVAGRVVMTVLHSHAAPIIRYELGDYAVLGSGTCPCGRSLPVLESIVGRTSGVIVTPSGECFHSIALYYIMKDFADKFGGIRQFSVRQTHLDRLEFHLATSAEFGPAAQHHLASLAQSRFGHEMRVVFVHHESLERSAAGKLRDFVSDLDTTQVRRLNRP